MSKSVIWKFSVATTTEDGAFSLKMPEDAKILRFDYDGIGNLCAWAEIPDVSRTKMMPKRRFRIIATGQEFEPEGTYIDTVFQRRSSPLIPTLVAHVYQIMAGE